MTGFALAMAVSIVSAVSFLVGIFILYRNWPYFSMQKIRGNNDDYIAVASFSNLIKEAEEKISISDHGNIMDESIYQNEGVIKTVEKKLEGSPNFLIECGFTSGDENKFRQKFETHPRVKIVQRVEPDLEYPHYKIVDGGKQAYLSRHDLGSNDRLVQYYNFSRVKPRSGQIDVQDKYMRPYLRDIENTFGGSL